MDEVLRRGERTALADPREAWTLLRALTRTHDRRALFLRLARERSEAARDAVERWRPFGPVASGPLPQHRRGSARAPAKVILPWLHHVQACGDEVVVGTTNEYLRSQARNAQRVAGLDSATGVERWAVELLGDTAWRGDDLVGLERLKDGSTRLRAGDAVTGAVLDEAVLEGEPWTIVASGDRAVLQSGGGPRREPLRLTAVDLQPASFGRVLWTTSAGPSFRVGGGVCVHPAGDAVRALDLSTGERLWERPRAEFGGPSAQVQHVARGRVIVHRDHPGYLVALDARTGETRWQREGLTGMHGASRFGPAHGLVRAGDADLILALDDGAATRVALDARVMRSALSGRLAAVGGQTSTRFVSSVIDLATGEVVHEARVKHDGFAAFSVLATETTATCAIQRDGDVELRTYRE